MTFECEPGTLKQSKLETIKSIGVTRLSLGVEHFDDEVLSANGRAHKSAEIFRAYQWAREVGFPQINIDLIAGMLGETEDKWKYAVEKAVGLDADSVTIYQMEVPFNTTIAKDAREHGGESAGGRLGRKRAWVDYAFKQFEAAGYVISSGYTLVKPERHAGFVYRDSLWHGADLVGTGVASFGHFQGVHYQNVDSWEQYIAKLDAGELPINRALPVTEHQLLIREMVLQLKTGRLDSSYFRKKFGVDIIREFRGGFDSIVSEGYAAVARRSNGIESRRLCCASIRCCPDSLKSNSRIFGTHEHPAAKFGGGEPGAGGAAGFSYALFAPQNFVPEFDVVQPDEIPSPSDKLLVHHSHMTLELERHFKKRPEVRVLQEHHSGDVYTRKINLAR